MTETNLKNAAAQDEPKSQNGQLVLVVNTNDWRTVLGMGLVSQLSDWPDNKVVHASNPSLPLNSRESRFLRIVGTYAVPNMENLAVLEVIESQHLDRHDVPPLWCRGHRIDLKFHIGTGSHARVEVPSVWELRLDGRTVGSLPAETGDLVKLGDEALNFAERYIEARVFETESRF
jgi:hypothetical protein